MRDRPDQPPCPECGGDCHGYFEWFRSLGEAILAAEDVMACGCSRRTVDASDGVHELGCPVDRAEALEATR